MKSTVIRVDAGPGRHISARSLFLFLAAAMEHCQLSNVDQISIYGEGDVLLNGEIVYQPRRTRKPQRIG